MLDNHNTLVTIRIFEACATCVPNPWVTVGFLTELAKHDIGVFKARNIISNKSTMDPFARSHKLVKEGKSAKLVRTGEDVFPGRDVSQLGLQTKSPASIISSTRGR